MIIARAIAVCLAVCIAALPLAPVAHAHEAGDAHDAAALLVHTHGEGHHHRHQPTEHQSRELSGDAAPHDRDQVWPDRDPVEHDHEAVAHHRPVADLGQNAIDHKGHETVILTLDPLVAAPCTYIWLASVPAVATVRHEPPCCERGPLATYVERLTHSPPRAPATLRGPPSSSRL